MDGWPPAGVQTGGEVISEGMQMFNGAPLLLLVALIRMARRERRGIFVAGRSVVDEVGREETRTGKEAGRREGLLFFSFADLFLQFFGASE